MSQYNSLNVELSNLELNKLKSAIKNERKVVLILSSNMIGNSDDETNFPHELLFTNRQVANHHRAFANNPSTDVKFSKTQSGGYLRRFLVLLLKAVIKPLAKTKSV